MPLAQFILYAGHAQAALIPHIKAMGQLDKWPGQPAVACGLVGLSGRLTKLTANIDNDDDSGAWTMPASPSASVSAAVAALPCATLDNGSACSRQSNMGTERCTCAVTYICPVAFVAAQSSGGCAPNHLAYGIRQTVYGQRGRKVKFPMAVNGPAR